MHLAQENLRIQFLLDAKAIRLTKRENVQKEYNRFYFLYDENNIFEEMLKYIRIVFFNDYFCFLATGMFNGWRCGFLSVLVSRVGNCQAADRLGEGKKLGYV